MGALSNSHFFCHRDSRTVFVFVLAQLEGPPQIFFGFNGNFNGKMTKINQMAKNHFSGVQINSQSVKMGVLGGVFVFKSGLRILIWAPKVQIFAVRKQ